MPFLNSEHGVQCAEAHLLMPSVQYKSPQIIGISLDPIFTCNYANIGNSRGLNANVA